MTIISSSLIFWHLVMSVPCSPQSNTDFLSMINYYGKRGQFTSRELSTDDWYHFPWHTLGLVEREPFAKIYNNPKLYIDCVKQYIKDPKNSRRSKQFAIFSLEKLPYKDCVDMLNFSYTMNEAGLISEHTLWESLHLSFSGSKVFLENINDDALQTVLSRMLADKKLSIRLKKSIQNLKNYKS